MSRSWEVVGSEAASATSLGSWVRLRRRTLGITQAELASRVPCAVITVRKIEADERRPSRQVAERLADSLELDPVTTERFLAAARTSFAPAALPEAIEIEDRRGSTPTPVTALIGRDDELGEAYARLVLGGGNARLLTITGPPGVGKTRLAMALALRIEEKLEVPTVWVDLAGVTEAATLAATVASTVTPPGLQGGSLDSLALRLLRRMQTVLVLDNCEHLLAGIDHVLRLLEDCPPLVCVATSRTRLDLHGEHELALDPLPVLDATGRPGPAIALFLDRAGEVSRRLPDPEDPLVHSIVDRVGGFPLAIELAALRLRDHDLADLDASLSVGLGSLGVNRRGVPARHSSLAAAVAWSESLLGPVERAALEALVVFPAGASAQAVADVAELDAGLVSAALHTLVEAALAVRTPPTGPITDVRYAPFVVVKEHVRTRLDQDWLTGARRRHAISVLRQAEARLPGITAWPEPVHLAALDDLDDDLQAALSCSFGPDGDPEIGVRLAVQAVSGWFFRGRNDDCVRWIDAAATTRPDSYMAQYLHAVLAWSAGHADAAERIEAALRSAEAADDPIWIAECAGMAQTIALSRGDVPRAAELGPRAAAAAASAGGEWQALMHLRSGGIALRLNDLAGARRHSVRCNECYQTLDSTWGQGTASVLAGSVAKAEGRHADAAAAYLRAAEFFSRLGFPAYVAAAIADCGHLLLALGRVEGAATLYGMVEAWLDELGIQIEPMSRHQWYAGRQQAQAALGGRYDQISGAGATMIRNLEAVRSVLIDAGLTPTPE